MNVPSKTTELNESANVLATLNRPFESNGVMTSYKDVTCSRVFCAERSLFNQDVRLIFRNFDSRDNRIAYRKIK